LTQTLKKICNLKIMDKQTLIYLGVAAAAVVIGYFIWKKYGKSEGYLRSGLEANSKYQDSYVDHASDPYANLNWKANHGNIRKPLEMGAINFYQDQIRLAEGNLFKATSVPYVGMHEGEPYFPNTAKARNDLMNFGNLTEVARRNGTINYNLNPDPVTEWRFKNHQGMRITRHCNELGQCGMTTYSDLPEDMD
jgi:hypothetical protein